MGEDVAEGVLGEQAEGVVAGEAGLAFGSGGGVPGPGGGGGGEAAEEAGELARGAEWCVFFLEERLDELEIEPGDFGWGGGREENLCRALRDLR